MRAEISEIKNLLKGRSSWCPSCQVKRPWNEENPNCADANLDGRCDTGLLGSSCPQNACLHAASRPSATSKPKLN
jgi:hypothetical protein